MPELPDVVVYVERLAALVVGAPLEDLRLASPFLVRTYDPPHRALLGKRVTSVERIGKRIVLGFEDDLYLVVHLMIAGRLRWKMRGVKIGGQAGIAAFDFPHGSVLFTEASKKRRASIHVVLGRAALREFDRGGIEPLEADLPAWIDALRGERHTLKRSLTDPQRFSGIGNAYSDEILHRARMSPVALSTSLSDDQIAVLREATRGVLTEWTDRLRTEVGEGFPDKVTAFRPEMAVHGRYQEPCPVCGDPVQRIVHAENETNYCATCQTEGKLLADRALSRLLKGDWPRSLAELDELKRTR